VLSKPPSLNIGNNMLKNGSVASLLAIDVSNIKAVLIGSGKNSLILPECSSKVTDKSSKVNLIELNTIKVTDKSSKVNLIELNTIPSSKKDSSLILHDCSSKVTDKSSKVNLIELNNISSSKKDSSLILHDCSSMVTDKSSKVNLIELNNLPSSKIDLVSIPSLDFPSKIMSTFFNTHTEVVNLVNVQDYLCHV